MKSCLRCGKQCGNPVCLSCLGSLFPPLKSSAPDTPQFPEHVTKLDTGDYLCSVARVQAMWTSVGRPMVVVRVTLPDRRTYDVFCILDNEYSLSQLEALSAAHCAQGIVRLSVRVNQRTGFTVVRAEV